MKLTLFLTAFVIFAFTLSVMAESSITVDDNGTRTIKVRSSKQKTVTKFPPRPYVILNNTYLYLKPNPHLYGHECTITAGSRVVVVEQQVTDEARMIRVTVADGMCRGRSGWVKAESMKNGEED